MKKIDVIFNSAIEFNRNNKIMSIKKLRQISQDFLRQSWGLRETKEIMDLLCINIATTAQLEVPDYADVSGFIKQLNEEGFNATCPQLEVASPFNDVVIQAVKSGNYKFAVAMLQAKIKFGGAYEG